MTGIMSIAEFVLKTKTIQMELEIVGHAGVAAACQMIADEARRVIGTYDYGWPSLAPSTLAKKSADTPLLETGEMRDSIEWHAEGNRGEIGSNNDKAVWHELGTSRIPPRPFLMGAAVAMEPKIHALFKRAVIAVILGKGLHSSELGELLHFLHVAHHIGHAVNEVAQKALDGPDDEKRR